MAAVPPSSLQGKRRGVSNSPFNPEQVSRTLARLFAAEGASVEVAVLANSIAQFKQVGTEECGFGAFRNIHWLHLGVPVHVFTQVADRLSEIESSIARKLDLVTRCNPDDRVANVVVFPQEPDSQMEGWRDKARVWLAGAGVNNQGRVRSDNIAPLNVDGLLFRSQEEVHLYRGLKRLGVVFAPLPVFLRGGDEYQRLEPDFVLLKDGIVMVVEVDGDTVHRETPAEAHERTAILGHSGAYIERIEAGECRTPELARQCAEHLLEVMAKHKANR
jgi:hypothetical protein